MPLQSHLIVFTRSTHSLTEYLRIRPLPQPTYTGYRPSMHSTMLHTERIRMLRQKLHCIEEYPLSLILKSNGLRSIRGDYDGKSSFQPCSVLAGLHALHIAGTTHGSICSFLEAF